MKHWFPEVTKCCCAVSVCWLCSLFLRSDTAGGVNGNQREAMRASSATPVAWSSCRHVIDVTSSNPTFQTSLTWTGPQGGRRSAAHARRSGGLLKRKFTLVYFLPIPKSLSCSTQNERNREGSRAKTMAMMKAWLA